MSSPGTISSDDDIYTTLAFSLAESLTRVEILTQSSLANIFTPLLPPILGKQDIITCLQKYKKVCEGVAEKLACLTLLTDYVVAAIASPVLVDIFQQDASNRSKKYVMEIVSREWVSLFRAILTSLPMYKPSKEAMESTLSFLKRMFLLLESFDQRFSLLLFSSVSDNCFWSFGLQSIDGREAPLKLILRIEKKFVDSVHQDIDWEEIFGPTDEDFSLNTKQSALPTKPSILTTKPSILPTKPNILTPKPSILTTKPSVLPTTSVVIGVRRLHVASLQLKCGVDQMINCQVETDGVELIITTRCGNCAKVMLGVKEMSAAVLSLTGEQLLFLYLTVPGCLTVQTSLDRLPGMSSPPLALLGGENRRVVVCVKKMGQEEGESLTDALRIVMGEQFAVVDQSFGKRLLAKTVDQRKLFTVADKKKGGSVAQPRYGDRRTGVAGTSSTGSKTGGGQLSLVSRYQAVESETDISCNYWADPALLLSTTPALSQFQDTTLALSQYQDTTPALSQYQVTALDLSCATLASQTSSPLPTTPTAKCTCMQANCSICRPTKAVSQPVVGKGALQGLDIPVIFANTKEEFLQVNSSNVQSKLPGKETLQAKYLQMKWEELTTAVKRKAGEDIQQGQVKRPRVNVIKNLATHPKESNGIISANIHTPDPATSPDIVTNSLTKFYQPKQPLLPPTKSTTTPHLSLSSIATMLYDQSTPTTGQCKCDDCLYVTKSHMERTKVAKTKCRCHPCVLRGKQMAEGLAKPWELVALKKYDGENYWLEPWIEDLFQDIKQKKVTVKQAADLTGTTYGQFYRHYKEGLGRLAR